MSRLGKKCPVSQTHPHSKLITAAAREVLGPLGLSQKGRSRTWLDDRGWWLGVVEFQPSSFSRGSYLNVGACFLWNPTDDLTFDYGYRVVLPLDSGRSEYVEYEDDEQFRPLARVLVETAAARVRELRELFRDAHAAADALSNDTRDDEHVRTDAGIASALAGERERAIAHFGAVIAALADADTGWPKELGERASELRMLLVSDDAAFEAHIEDQIAKTRTRLRIPPTHPNAVPQAR